MPNRNICWTPTAWSEYIYWQGEDRKIPTRINDLIKDILRDPFHGIGKPEPLKGSLKGFWSRRITQEHRLVYKVDDDSLYVLQCRFHY